MRGLIWLRSNVRGLSYKQNIPERGGEGEPGDACTRAYKSSISWCPTCSQNIAENVFKGQGLGMRT
jgi:hypothetical protein